MDIRNELRDSRARTLELALDLDDAQWMGPRLAIVNPMLWEVGHIGWFQEHWTLRRHREPSLRADADSLYDSARIPHDTRWDLPLPTREQTLEYMRDVLVRCLDAFSEDEPYFHLLSLFHEDMHGEALTYTRQTLGYPEPRFALREPGADDAGPCPGDVDVPGARLLLGAKQGGGFVFDNEKWAHPVDVGAFRMARAPVTNEQYASFVDAGGYGEPRFWSEAGWNVAQPCGRDPSGVLGGHERRMARAGVRPGRAVASAPAGDPRVLVRGGGILQLGRASLAHRGRVGARGCHS